MNLSAIFIFSLLPNPPDYAKVGGHWVRKYTKIRNLTLLSTIVYNRGIQSDVKLRSLTKIDLNVMQFGKSMQNILSKIANSWLRRFSALFGLNFGATAT